MRLNILSIMLCIGVYHSHAQSFGDSETCNVNAQDNGSDYARQYRTAPREATFKYTYTDKGDAQWNCTGTLINRHTNDADVGFYFLTARHCSHDIDYNVEHDTEFQQKTLQMNDGNIKLNLEQEAKGVYNVVLSNKKKSYKGKIVFE